MESVNIGNVVNWYLGPCKIKNISKENGMTYYHLEHINYPLNCKVSQEKLENFQSNISFSLNAPSMLIVDNFYDNPDLVRSLALEQDFYPNIKAYKGLRSTRFLFPGLKEKFEKLLGKPISNWLNHGANGVFQITKYTDPLVYHSDYQSYAAAVYLTPNAPLSAGTSFWRDGKYGCRRPPTHPLEKDRFDNDEARNKASGDIYSEYNLLTNDGTNWELVDKVGSVYNRLVIWDAQLIHSASSYTNFTGTQANDSRLVQLFFFDI